MSKQRSNPDFMNGVPELVILNLLARRPMYGYEIVQALKAHSDEALSFGEGCVYPVLHKLEQQGFLSSRREAVNGRSRVVYRPTKSGHRRLAQAVAQWQHVVAAVNGILQGGNDAQPIFT